MKRAVVDIGTNSVLLTIADINGREIENVTELSRITRLGKGFAEENIIREENIEITLNALREFSDKIHNKGVEKVRYIATEVLRRAKNSDYVIKRLSNACLGNIEIVDEYREAYYSFCSVSYMNPSKEICVVDIGGGSTEIITGIDDKVIFTKSLRLGAVNLYEKFFSVDDTYKRNDILRATGYINGMLEKDIPPDIAGNFISAYIVGGTITNVAAILDGMTEYKPEVIEGKVISFTEIDGLLETLSQIKREERAKIAGIEHERADILPAGILILRTIMNYLNKDTIRVSTRGVRWGILFKTDEEGE